MKLYYSKGACSLVVRIILNELEISFESIAVDLKAKEIATGKDFLQINPKGSVPVLELDDGRFLTENAVILQYLADSSSNSTLLPRVSDFARYRVLEWLNFITTELHKGFGPFFMSGVPDEVKKNLFVPRLKAKFTYIDNHLKADKALYGDAFTLADAYLYVMIRWGFSYKLGLSDLSDLVIYVQKLSQRKSIQQALAQEQLCELSY